MKDNPMPERIYRMTVRVPYAHVDQMGFVYYANYFVYFEMARAELLREARLPYPEMERKGIRLPVVDARCEYRRPAHYDDELDVLTRCTALLGPRLRIEYEIRRGNETIVTGSTEHVCVTPDGKVMRPGPEIRSLVEKSAGGTV
jgi:acyl-CoA thioester hydrolase